MAAAATAAPATSSGNASAPAPLPAAAPGGGGGAPGAGGGGAGAQFREIHKNTWLKRLTADGKRLTVGPKVGGTERLRLVSGYYITCLSEIWVLLGGVLCSRWYGSSAGGLCGTSSGSWSSAGMGRFLAGNPAHLPCPHPQFAWVRVCGHAEPRGVALSRRLLVKLKAPRTQRN